MRQARKTPQGILYVFPRRLTPPGVPGGRAHWGEEERTQRLRATNGSPKQSVFSDDDAKKTVANGLF